ncbi:DUF3488 domain-containing protein [Sphingomonas pruni]|uniref:DUF3488 domain-containing protein n=1 Tax=Sphingomonas pruni TaxID=40683 RepID=UPI00082F2EFA|nr:hypothetical protein [Sphingomonas pruni]
MDHKGRSVLAPGPALHARDDPAIVGYGIRPATLASALVSFLVFDQVMLWHFLGLVPPILVVSALVALPVAFWPLTRRTAATSARLPWKLLGICFAVSLVVYILGGEGRLFYANVDWQVRGAVLRDLVNYPWPVVYDGADPKILRLPLGMYLVPAWIGKQYGFPAAELAELLQNTLLLTAVLALGSTLFTGTRARLIALGVFLGFSGMDVIGALLTGYPIYSHIEQWSIYQFSSHITQAFWVPQHSLAGWIGALCYLLWRDDKAPAALLFCVVPLSALLSPLAFMGLLPFAAHAAVSVVLRRELHVRELASPALAVLLSLPSLAYLTAAADTVGAHFEPPVIPQYLAIELLEIVPFFVGLKLAARTDRFGRTTFAIVAIILLLAPLGKVGRGIDFVMRVSIPALAILSVLIADLFSTPPDASGRRGRRIVLGAFLIGLATPATEIGRAIFFPRSPAPLCSYLGVVPGGATDYVASLSRLPVWIRPNEPAMVRPRDPKQCWNGPWPKPIT